MPPFAIIPVLDLKGGQVVHARAGERARYLPIRSRLVASSEPRSVLDAILSLAPFHSVYIADLDAIEGRGGHDLLLDALARRYAGVEFWVDGGFSTAREAVGIAERGFVPVLGSESLSDESVPAATMKRLGTGGCVLSLDYRADRFLGPAAIETHSESWPDRVIAMTLSRVGGGAGPDLARLAALQPIAGGRRLFAAGGVRDASDLDRLAAMRIAGVLVASALHDGRLAADALLAYAGA